MSNWFYQLVGFEEKNPEQVREHLILEGGRLTSRVNGKTYDAGTLEVVTLHELRAKTCYTTLGKNKVSEVIGDVQSYHLLPQNNRAIFQAASQFNLLEMVHPGINPEDGVTRYEHDHTQGPACAIACGAGTIYRNYFTEVNGQIGQTQKNQIDCLSEVADYFNNSELGLWEMRNGYVLAHERGLEEITQRILDMNVEEYEHLKGLLKIGIQKETQVTLTDRPQFVSQVYCSALPVAYSSIDAQKWAEFSKLILDATYEATILAALENRERTDSQKVYLTLVGGGAFGNRSEWIIESVTKNLKKFANAGLDINFVSYSQASGTVAKIMGLLV